MKKVLITMCAAIAVLACTKTEVAFDEPNEIAFSPVSKFETKAAVTGENYTDDLNFYAWAYTAETTPVAYFSEILFTPEYSQTGAPAGLTSYTGHTPQYWPNEKALKFAGVTQSGNVAENIIAMSDATTITVTGYDQPLPNGTGANDLLWFFDDNSDAGYTKPAADATSVHVQPTMHHACSWIVVKVALDEDLETYWTGVKVNSIMFETLLTTGDVNLTETTATWNNQGTSESNIVVYEGTTENGITTTAKEFAASNDAIVIPQTPTTLALNITYTTPAGGTVTETIDEIDLDYDGATDTNTAWAPGKKYTYTLTIGADVIKIAPKSEDWGTGSGSGLAQDVK